MERNTHNTRPDKLYRIVLAKSWRNDTLLIEYLLQNPKLIGHTHTHTHYIRK